MEQENRVLTPEEQWQQSEDERLEYEGYCRKIIQGLENQDEKSGIRAIWELVQNAKDQSKTARIKGTGGRVPVSRIIGVSNNQ